MRTKSPVALSCATNVESVVSSRSSDCGWTVGGNAGGAVPPPLQAVRSAAIAAAANSLVCFNNSGPPRLESRQRERGRYLCRCREADLRLTGLLAQKCDKSLKRTVLQAGRRPEPDAAGQTEVFAGPVARP